MVSMVAVSNIKTYYCKTNRLRNLHVHVYIVYIISSTALSIISFYIGHLETNAYLQVHF